MDNFDTKSVKKPRKPRRKKVVKHDKPLDMYIMGVHIYVEKSKVDYCMADKFLINDINASILDFGISKDTDKEHAPSCGCGYREFIISSPSGMILDKYHITREQADLIAKQLKKYLFVGYCKKCHFG